MSLRNLFKLLFLSYVRDTISFRFEVEKGFRLVEKIALICIVSRKSASSWIIRRSRFIRIALYVSKIVDPRLNLQINVDQAIVEIRYGRRQSLFLVSYAIYISK